MYYVITFLIFYNPLPSNFHLFSVNLIGTNCPFLAAHSLFKWLSNTRMFPKSWYTARYARNTYVLQNNSLVILSIICNQVINYLCLRTCTAALCKQTKQTKANDFIAFFHSFFSFLKQHKVIHMIPSTINIWKKLLSTAIWADKNRLVSGRIACISSKIQRSETI